MKEQYATPGNLDARIALHRRYTPEGEDVFDFIRRHYSFAASDRVLEVGCGPGGFWIGGPSLSADPVLTDVSWAMVDAARSGAASGVTRCLAVADADALPFPDGAFDVLLAHFMLYHVSDKVHAVAEFHRILTSDGWVGIVLTAPGNMSRVLEPFRLVVPRLPRLNFGGASFTADQADPLLRDFFRVVDRLDYELVMQVDDAESIIDYARSLPSVQSASLSQAEWASVRTLVADEIAALGAFDVVKSCSLFRCHKGLPIVTDG